MERLILFDGVCNFCNSSVQFVIKRDPDAKFRFMPLQSEKGQQMLQSNGFSGTEYDSVILSEDGRVYRKSTAALRIAKELRGLWPLFYYMFILVPPFIRDAVYSFIADRRYRWFGKKDACMIPTPEIRSRFL